MSYSDYALIKKSTLTGIGDAIRAQKGTNELIDPADFSSEIESIEGGVPIEPVLQDKVVARNGVVTPDEGYDGLSSVTIAVTDKENMVNGWTYADCIYNVTGIDKYEYPYLMVRFTKTASHSLRLYFAKSFEALSTDSANLRMINETRYSIDGIADTPSDWSDLDLITGIIVEALSGDNVTIAHADYQNLNISEDSEYLYNYHNFTPPVVIDTCWRLDAEVPVNDGSFTSLELQEKTVYTNGEVVPDEGYYGLSKVTVSVPTDGSSSSHVEIPSIVTDGLSYINTYICPNPNYTIEMEFKISQIVENNWDFLFGCKFGNTSGIAARFDTGESGTLAVKRSYTYSTAREWGVLNVTRNDFSDYRVFKLAKNEAYIDDALVYTFTGTTEVNEQHYAYPLYLFTVNDSNTTYLNNSGYLDVKYVKLWDEKDNLVLDLIPVVKNDGTVCMYNKVNGGYYYNAGTGKFTTKLNFVIDNVLYLRSEGGVKIPTGCSVAGNYTDTEGQAWLYNTVDLATKTKTQRVRSIVLDGSESWGRNTKTFNGSTYYDFYVANPHDMQNYITTIQTNDIGPVYINDFRVWSQYDVNNSYYTSDRLRTGFINATAVLFTGNAGALAYLNLIDKDCMGLTVDEWKAHLAANPKTLYYAVNSPVQSTLTDEEIAIFMES